MATTLDRSMTLDRSPWRNSTYIPPAYPAGPSTFAWTRSSSGWPPARKVSLPTLPETLPPDRDILEGLKMEESAKELKVPEATEIENDDAIQIKACHYIGSYTWMNRESPTIIVPGAPPQWQDRPAPYNVQPDRGVFFVDQNGYRLPHAPLLPLITAVNARSQSANHQEFEWPTVDFVTDRDALCKLVLWARSDDPKDRDFRIDLELAADKTVLMNRWEKKTRDKFNGRTYRSNFEKSSTLPSPDCRDGTGHYRIVTYDLNGLKMVVRFKVDACIPRTRNHSRRSLATVDELSTSLASVDLANHAKPTYDKRYHLSVLKGGYEVSPPATMEISTQSEWKQHEFDMRDLYSQLFFSQTNNHVLATHTRGRFKDITRRKLSCRELWQDLDKEVQPQFKAVHRTLQAIQTLMIEHGSEGRRRMSLVCKDGVLKVYERAGENDCLPDHFLALFKA